MTPVEFWEIPGRTLQKHKDFQKTRRACIHGKMGPKMQYQRPGGLGDCFQTKGPLFIPIGNDKQTVVDTRLLPGESAKTKYANEWDARCLSYPSPLPFSGCLSCLCSFTIASRETMMSVLSQGKLFWDRSCIREAKPKGACSCSWSWVSQLGRGWNVTKHEDCVPGEEPRHSLHL